MQNAGVDKRPLVKRMRLWRWFGTVNQMPRSDYVLNDYKSLPRVLLFKPGGSSTEVLLYGGKVVSWNNSQGEELHFMSRNARGRFPKGGISLCSPQIKMPFHRRQHIEVRGIADGLQESYYAAKVMAVLPNNQYRVKYATLYTDDESQRLEEIVSEHRIRPRPFYIILHTFSTGDIVDVDYRDGWWKGQVVENNDGYYGVTSRHYQGVHFYDWDKLRIHQV